MYSTVAKSTSVSQFIKATSMGVPSAIFTPTKVIPPASSSTNIDFIPLTRTKNALDKDRSTTVVKATSGIIASAQFRYAHTDLHVPDFTQERRSATRDPRCRSEESADGRKLFTYVFTGVTAAAGLMVAKTLVHKTVFYLHFNQDAVATGTMEIDISAITEGKSATFSWRNKPVFVKHRTPEEIERERAVNIEELRDPETDDQRIQRPEWLITVGICTHLGCIPIPNKGDYPGGYFCPCHGSHYDAAGRIRKGPASNNLALPPYKFVNDTTVVIG